MCTHTHTLTYTRNNLRTNRFFKVQRKRKMQREKKAKTLQEKGEKMCKHINTNTQVPSTSSISTQKHIQTCRTHDTQRHTRRERERVRERRIKFYKMMRPYITQLSRTHNDNISGNLLYVTFVLIYLVPLLPRCCWPHRKRETTEKGYCNACYCTYTLH